MPPEKPKKQEKKTAKTPEKKSTKTKAKISDETEDCLDCHRDATPGIVADWESSRHSRTSVALALKKPVLSRRVSAKKVPAKLANVVVGCYECHGLRPKAHKDNFEHGDYKINVIVSPRDCAVCHPQEEKEYSHSKKANAIANLEKNPLYHTLVQTLTSRHKMENGQLKSLGSSDTAKAESCYACHGTKIEVKGMKKIKTEDDELEVPNLVGWPNQGVGRINPDGSKGACTSCHPRHSFSIEVARKPYTCSQCHMAPDAPAWEVYRESKHGNIFQSLGAKWNWNKVPWTVGKDFKAPTCSVCHSSEIVNSEGEVLVKRSHDFGARLWVRIFGLIYSHPQPKSGATYRIKGLPAGLDGKLATAYLIDGKEQARRQKVMKSVCKACHSTSWTDLYFQKFHRTIKEADQMVKAATQLLQKGWKAGLADPKNPFDEALEYKWMQQWLFYANKVRYGSAMAGPDYAGFKGWFYLNKNLQDMKKALENHEKHGVKKSGK